MTVNDYALIGIGSARMLADVHKTKLRIYDIFTWFIVCAVYAATGDCE